MTEPSAAIDFDQLRTLTINLPPADSEAATAALVRQTRLTKPRGSLGRLEELAIWLARWQRRHPPEMRRPRVAVFAANHGIAGHGVSAYPPAVTAQMVLNFQNGGGAINQICRTVDADLRVYELDLDHPTEDFCGGPAMTEEGCCQALAYGMMAAEPGLDVLCLGEMGIGNTTAAAALCYALFGGPAERWVGPGTGVDAAGIERKIRVIEAGLAANRDSLDDAFAVLRCLGGFELAAIVGAVLAAQVANVPVVLDGFTCTAAAAVLYRLNPHALDHCLVAHVSAEPGHRHLLAHLEKAPLMDLGMRLGEGSGAALAIPMLRAAAACHSGMATFRDAGVSERIDRLGEAETEADR